MSQAPVIANVEMAAAWDGHEGDMWTEQADHYEHAGWRQWPSMEATGFLAAGARVLDIGCGTGRQTRDTARLVGPRGSVLAIDLSSRMIEEGRRRAAAEGLANVEFVQGDAQVFPFEEGAFDVAISSFGTMFFNDPVAAFANVGSALRPGGRLATLAWRELARNEWLLEMRAALSAGRQLPEPPVDAPGPLALARPDYVRSVLGAAGFVDIDLQPVDEPLELGKDTDDAYAFVLTAGIVEGLTKDLDAETRTATLGRLRTMLAAHETPEGVLLGTSAWLITAARPS